MTHISIILVHYNTEKETDACLASLAKILHPGFEYSVVIVDNGSREEYTLPKNYDASRSFIVRSEANLGFTGGNNLGIYQAIEKYNSDYVLLLNSDTVVDPRFLSELYSELKKDHSNGMCSPKIYFYPGNEYFAEYDRADRGKVFWFAGGSIDWGNVVAFHRGVDEVDRGQFAGEQKFDFATGCCVLIRREVLEKIGLFDKNYFLYMEDVDLSLRTKKAGYKLVFAPKAVVWHKNAGSSGGAGSAVHEYYQMRNRMYFVYKHGTWRAKLLAVRVAIQTLTSGSRYARKGLLHACMGQLGKQPIL